MLTNNLGQPLPNQGTCKHYKHSHRYLLFNFIKYLHSNKINTKMKININLYYFRWLRFPCCGKAFPCDVCHEINTNSEHEAKVIIKSYIKNKNRILFFTSTKN